MRQFCVHGVVRAGQVVLDIPLDLPDGTIVTVTDSDPEDAEIIGPMGPPSPELAKKMILGLIGRNDLLDDHEWRLKLGVDRE